MRALLLGFCLVLVTGCASITTGQNQSLSIETPGCLAATCKLSNDKGTWYVSSTPGTVTVQRAYGELVVACEKGEYKGIPVSVASTTKAMAFGNIIFGGIIGAAVDVGTGAAYDYPPTIAVNLICTGDPKTAQQVAAPAVVPVVAPASATPVATAKPQI
jgi:hypothetical protein